MGIQVVILLLFLFGVLLVLDNPSLGTVSCVVPFFGFIIWMLTLQTNQMTLTTHAGGLEYCLGKTSVTSSWDNLYRLSVRPNAMPRRSTSMRIKLYTAAVGVVLRNSVCEAVQGNRLEKLIFRERFVDYIPLSDIVSVPVVQNGNQIQINMQEFANTAFGKELLHYAPHLFEKEYVDAKSQG